MDGAQGWYRYPGATWVEHVDPVVRRRGRAEAGQ